MTDSMNDNAIAPELRELIERRTSLQQWLSGLDNQRGVASERILKRVREDYEGRLAATNAELSEHVAGIRSELERAVEQTAAAERLHDGAMDTLEEARLRHAIGELPDDGWPDRERQLMEAVQTAKIAEDEARTAADRLRDLLGTLTQERATVPEEPATVPEEPAEVPANEQENELPGGPGAVVSEVPGEASQGEPSESELSPPQSEALPPPAIVDADATVESGTDGAADEGEAFIEQVSVAVEAEVPSDAPGLFDQNEIPSAEKKPPPGLKCAECGYTNDLSAWFCGVCGADVG